MPIIDETIVSIACDNPDCPGNDLDPHSRSGWLIVSAEIYGESMNTQYVFCSLDCLSAHAAHPDEPMVSRLTTPEIPVATPATEDEDA